MWLASNAELDAGLGLPLGSLSRSASPTAVPSAADEPSSEPTAGATPSPSNIATSTPAGHGVVATQVPTQVPTQAPVASSAPSPAGVVGLGTLGVADNTDGTLTFSWTAFTDAPFSGYLLEYELTSSGKVPSLDSPRWATASTVATFANVAGIGPGDYQVRIQAVSTLGGVARVLGQTVVGHVHMSAGHPTSSASPTP
jgi:hypothetical protein